MHTDTRGSAWEDRHLPYQLQALRLQPQHHEGTMAIYRDAESAQAFWCRTEFKGKKQPCRKFYSPVRFSLAIPTYSLRIQIMLLRSRGF